MEHNVQVIFKIQKKMVNGLGFFFWKHNLKIKEKMLRTFKIEQVSY